VLNSEDPTQIPIWATDLRETAKDGVQGRKAGILELEVKSGENRVRIRGVAGTSQEVFVAAFATAAHAEAAAASAAAKDEDQERDIVVKSPIVGTFYDASAPGSEPFVKNGDRVEPTTVLCIIESMKLMNEIEAEVAGTVIAKHVESGLPVEYGESLFTIRSN
jgi:acetyl-CoA carboxylase biotin carboxyl carrier protein